MLGQFLDNLLLVRDGERGCGEDLGELGILFENLAEGVERFGSRVEGVGFGGCGVLRKKNGSLAQSLPIASHASFNHPPIRFWNIRHRTRALA